MDAFFNRLTGRGTIIASAGVVLVLFTLIIPLPAPVIDILLVFNIGFSLLLLIVTMSIHKPLEISSFPSILLIITLFRLSLNVATTRSILLHAYGGEVIKAFGNFVVGGNYVVGAVIFIIIIVIQFVVITRGATRIAEVAARFSLDGMPGKQMAVDADLNSGLITETEANERRSEIRREADFYGAMDGASKFVRGDAIAGIIITFINIIGGFAIGILQRHMSLASATGTYTILTIGDGLVAQIPALIISTAAGIIVTRAASDSDLGKDIISQMLVNPTSLFVVAGVLLLCAAVPGFPFFPFLFLSAVMGGLGYAKRRSRITEKIPKAASEKAEEPEDIQKLLRVDPLELEVGYGLVSLVERTQGNNLLDRIGLLRRRIAEELGLIVPPIRIRDNLELKYNEYEIKLKGVEVGKGTVMLGELLAMNPGTARGKLKGIETKEPVFGLPAYWVSVKDREQADALGYTTVEPSAVITTHLQEIIKSHAYELLGRQELQNVIDKLKESHPALVNELIPNVMKLGDVQKVLQGLLKERISIRDLVTILEALADSAATIRDVTQLTEIVRQSLARSISKQYQADGKMNCVTVDPKLEHQILESIQRTEGQQDVLALSPDLTRKIFNQLSLWTEKLLTKNYQPIIVCSPHSRPYIHKLISPILPHFTILSYAEIAPGVELNSIGKLEVKDEH